MIDPLGLQDLWEPAPQPFDIIGGPSLGSFLDTSFLGWPFQTFLDTYPTTIIDNTLCNLLQNPITSWPRPNPDYPPSYDPLDGIGEVGNILEKSLKKSLKKTLKPDLHHTWDEHPGLVIGGGLIYGGYLGWKITQGKNVHLEHTFDITDDVSVTVWLNTNPNPSSSNPQNSTRAGASLQWNFGQGASNRGH
jgi:hypothetical protein